MVPSAWQTAPILLTLAAAGVAPGGQPPAGSGSTKLSSLACPSDKQSRLDLYGDPLPDGVVARLGTVRLRHGEIISGAVFSGDGRSIIVSDFYSGVHVWDADSGKEVRRFYTTDHYCHKLAISPDGRTLAVVLADSTVRLCDPATGRELDSLPSHPNRINDMAFSPDSTLLATTSAQSVRIYEVATRKLLRTVPVGDYVGTVSFSRDGRLLACSVPNSISLRAVEDGREVRRLRDTPPGKESLYATFAASGGALAIWGYEDASVRLFDGDGVKEVRRFNREPPLQADAARPRGATVARFSPDGKVLAIVREVGRIEVWEVETGKKLRALAFDSSQQASELAFSPDGTRLASAGWDNWGGDNTVRLWDVKEGKELLPRTGHGSPVESVAVAPDGATVATAGRDGIIHLWAGGSGRHLARLEADRNRRPQVLYSSDGQRLIWWGAYAWSKTLRVWDPKTGQPVRRFDLEGPDVLWAAVSDDGKTAVSVDWKNKLDRFHDLTTGKVTREVPDDFHRPIALSPSGDRLVGLDGTLMTVAGRKELVNIPRVYASSASVRFAADGRRLIAAAIAERSYKKYLSEPPAEEVAVVDTVEGKELRRFGLETDFRAIHAVALSRDGKTAVTVRGSGQKPNEQVVTLWETETGRERGYFRGHIGKVNGLAISPDGRFIMSASDDTTALVWDATRPRTRDGFVRRESGPADLPDRFKDLAGENAERAYASIWTLVNAPKDAVPFLADQGELFATTDVKKIRQWIQNLDHDRYADRERATQELGLVLDEAESNLREELRTNRSEEARRRIELLLQARSTGVTGRELQRLRVIEVLEHVAAEGGEATRRAAVAVLKRLGDMPGRPTHEAKATLERLGRGAELKP